MGYQRTVLHRQSYAYHWGHGPSTIARHWLVSKKIFYLDIDGAMSYAMVWLNDRLVGGWPYGYNSFRLDLTLYLRYGEDNQVAIRLDNPVDSSQWYPGAGLYRNVWITKVESIHVDYCGTHVTTRNVSGRYATIGVATKVKSITNATEGYSFLTNLHIWDPTLKTTGVKVASFPAQSPNDLSSSVNTSIIISNPRLWGSLPLQTQNTYVAITRIASKNCSEILDTYATSFGIRSFTYSGELNLSINGQRLKIQGVNQHCHDLGALGSAWNERAAERQLEHLRELGVNAIRMAHNPPTTELLDLCDHMGFIVMVAMNIPLLKIQFDTVHRLKFSIVGNARRQQMTFI